MEPEVPFFQGVSLRSLLILPVVVVQLLSSISLWLHGLAYQTSLSFTISQSLRVLIFQGLLRFHMNFNKGFFVFAKKCYHDSDEDCVGYIDSFG